MPKARELSTSERHKIITLSENTTKTHRQIATVIGISHSTVTRIINTYRNTGSSTPKQRSGRPRVTSKRTDAVIHRLAVKSPFITANEIKAQIDGLCDHISVDTIKRRLRSSFSAPARKPRKKPLLTAAMRRKRLAFCRKYKSWSPEDWRKVLFSDESTFEIAQNTHHHVRRPSSSNPNDPRYTVRTVKHPVSVMVWGCFSHHGRGGLTFLQKNQRMNSASYIDILDEKLIQHMSLAECSVFQQDSAPCHVSKTSMKWFREKNIELLDWPGNSPDLNPIENLWRIVKKKVQGKTPSSLDQLKEEIKRIWCLEISKEVCENLSNSMPRRIAAVLKNRGYSSKY